MKMSSLDKQVINVIRRMESAEKYEKSNANPITIRIILKLIQVAAIYEENDDRYYLALISILNEAIVAALAQRKIKEADIPSLLDSVEEKPKQINSKATHREIEALSYLNNVGITDYDFLIDALSDEYLQMVGKGLYLILKYGENSPEVIEFFDSLTKYIEE